ncbi:MAG: M18 family aminopeptidase, partial [Treponema sp.]|nr:M18 family aminopeptidase [Treponema sp.]
MNGQNEKNKSAGELLDFIERSPSPFHVIKNLEDELTKASFTKLEEGKEWNLKCGGKYFVTRNSSSIISFALPECKDFEGFMLTASHSDSPSFKIKENPCIKSEGKYIKLNVEKYGGMLCAPWFDRPLSVAGRIICKAGEDGKKITLRQHLVNADKDLLMIPNLAIHMNRDANEGHKFNVQNELLPIFCGLTQEAAKGKDCEDSDPFIKEIASCAGVSEKDIVSADLFLYNREKGSFWGKDGEFIASPKIDDLECVWTSFRGFLEAVKDTPSAKNICVHCVFDNEEVGSLTRQGAASTFLYDT